MDILDNALWMGIGFALGYAARWATEVLSDVREDVSRLMDGRRDEDS